MNGNHRKQHCPLPWKLSDGPNNCIVAANGQVICTMAGVHRESNLKYIIKCVNAYNDLVEAVKPLAKFSSSGVYKSNCLKIDTPVYKYNDIYFTIADIKKAEAALAKISE